MKTDAFEPHAHEHCIVDAMHAAEQLCTTRGVRLTDIRRRVLELVWESHQPLGAYGILDRLTAEGHKPAPPTVYRALDFLLEQGLVHRIASLNAYMGCADPAHQHLACFFLCEACGNAEELEDSHALMQALKASADKRGFRIRQPMLEIGGICRQCRVETEQAGD